MLDATALAAVLPILPVQSFSGILYRTVTLEALFGFHHNPPYPSVRPLYNLGAPATGARFTPRGGMASLYLAADTDAAIAEVNPVYASLRRQTPPVMVTIPPCVVYSVNVSLNRILDLTDPVIQSALQTNPAELSAAWRIVQNSGGVPSTQLLGQAAFASGQIFAMRYSSAQLPGHACYIVFTDRLTNPAFIEVYDGDL